MLPLGSAKHHLKTVPLVTISVIALNLYVFYLELMQGQGFVLRWAATPSEINSGTGIETLLTSMFLHAGWLHLIFNMIFLWGFGPVVEDAQGSFRYFFFYVFGGLAAMAAHVFFGAPASSVPLLGASGAVAAVMGAFLVIYPRDNIRTLIFLFPIFRVMLIPAIVLIGLWVLLQVVGAWIGGAATGDSGGVAYMAHIGGVVFGILCGRLFLRPH